MLPVVHEGSPYGIRINVVFIGSPIDIASDRRQVADDRPDGDPGIDQARFCWIWSMGV